MNTFGNCFRITTFGESHGIAEGAVIDGCPPGIEIDDNSIRADLLRRSGPRNEPDIVEWLSGTIEGRTTGTPLTFIIRNRDARPQDYEMLRNSYRAGHADYTYQQRYQIRDHRGGGRASARETVVRVVAGSVAKQILDTMGIRIECECSTNDSNANVGGTIRCTIEGVPAGIGTPVFGKTNAQLAAAMMSIPSAIGFEMGSGFAASEMTGEEYTDLWNPDFTTQTNHCGGIQGGITNGMPIEFRVAFHPIVTNPHNTQTIDKQGTVEWIQPGGRHDQCQIPRTAVIVEAMAAITLLDIIMSQQPTYTQPNL